MIPRDVTKDQNDLLALLDWLASYGVDDPKKGKTQKELAEATNVPESSIGEVVRTGEAAGWLRVDERPRGPPMGGTEHVVYLTRLGAQVAAQVRVVRLHAGEAALFCSGSGYTYTGQGYPVRASGVDWPTDSTS